MTQKGKSNFRRPVYVGASTRSPIGKFGGSLKHLSAPRLASLALKECAKRAAVSKTDFIYMGHARQAGTGPNPARQATIFAGLPESTPAMTVNQACASGLSALILGAEQIAANRASQLFAGGVESMSNTPYLLLEARFGKKMGHGKLLDGMTQDGFHCPMADMPMGETVETYLAKELKVSRQEQDEYALLSQQRAAKAWAANHFANEIFTIAAEGKNPGLSHDEHMRADTSLESLAKLPPVFDPKGGSVSAGNSSGITDGAAFLHLSAERVASSQAELLDYEIVALDPRRMGLGPTPATRNLLARQGLSVNDIEAFEVNEAFAAQVIACNRELKIPMEKLNAWGGAIALGHPIGSTGARLSCTLMSRLKGKKDALGLVTLCVSGGQGVALLFKSL